MIVLLIVAVCSLLLGHLAGATSEWQRILDYLDTHLDRDPDWLRSGIAADEHHRTRRRRLPRPGGRR